MNKFYYDLKLQGIPVAKDTLHHCLGHLEDAFLIRTDFVDAASERRRMVNPRKIYPVDPGLIPVFDRSGKPNVGHALETCALFSLGILAFTLVQLLKRHDFGSEWKKKSIRSFRYYGINVPSRIVSPARYTVAKK